MSSRTLRAFVPAFALASAVGGTAFAQATPIHVVMDGADVAGAEVYVDAQLRGTTDARGVVSVDHALLTNDKTTITARSKVYEVPAFLPGHGDEDGRAGWVMRAYVTSVMIDDAGKVNRLVVHDGSRTQEVVLKRDNVLIGLQVLVSLDWDMEATDFTQLMELYEVASRYLWNATDGQFIFEQVKIADQTQNWDRSEFRLWADNTLRARTTQGGFLGQNAVGSLVGSYINISWRDPSIHLQSQNGNWGGEDPRTFVHEFGHLGFSLGDEYSDVLPESCTPQRSSDPAGSPFMGGGEAAACIMDSQFSSVKFCSKHASNRHQPTFMQSDDCWSKIRGAYSDPQGSRWILKTPTTRNKIVGLLRGASGTEADAFPLEWNTKFVITNKGWPSALCKPFLQKVTFASGEPAALSTVKLLYTSIDPSQHSWISEGKTLTDGSLAILGAHAGDTVMTQTTFVSVAACPNGSYPEAALGVSTVDTDGDHVPDGVDSCPTTFNPFDLTSGGSALGGSIAVAQTQPNCTCISDANCAAGLVCQGTAPARRCAVPACVNDNQCGAGRKCQQTSAGGSCIAALGTHCNSSADCGISSRCDVGDGTSKTGLCTPTPGTGQTSMLCTDDRQCRSNNCGGLRPEGNSWRPGTCASVPTKALGEYCFGNAGCASGYCDAGDRTSKTHLCMPNNNGNVGDLCSADAQCRSTNCGGLAPGADSSWRPGHCSASSTKALGEYCFGNAQCGSGYCDAGPLTSQTNRCMPNKNGVFGDVCSNDNQCTSLNCSGLSVVNGVVPGTCGGKKALGVSCTAHSQCNSGFCDGGDGTSKTFLCMPNNNGTTGDICSKDSQCVSGNCGGLTARADQTWQPGRCSADSQKALGEFCFGSGQCHSGFCDGSTNLCMPNRNGASGDVCSNDNQCSSLNCAGIVANSRGARVGHCAAKRALGAPCDQHFQCGSGHCDAGDGTSHTGLCMPDGTGRSGDICSHPNQCMSRVCVGLHAEGNAWIPGRCQ